MEKINDNINRFLPYGESLRAILQHPSIKDTERKQLLRMKGVFVNNSDEDSTFPILTTSLLSPVEFDFQIRILCKYFFGCQIDLFHFD